MVLRVTSISAIVSLIAILFQYSCNEFSGNGKKGFITGADISALSRYERYGAEYRENGEAKDPVEIFTNNGYNFFRLRVFHSPNHEGPVCNDLAYTIALAKRIKKAGANLLIDFHYSDTWAGPGHQIKPAAWKDCDINGLVDSVYQYSLRVVNALGENGAAPDMVQIGNEINGGMLWPEGKIYKTEGVADYESIGKLLKAGIKGVKDSKYGQKTEIMIHLARGGDFKGSKRFFDNIIEQEVNFDVIGESYYPWWHGAFDSLESNLRQLSDTYDKKIVIAETSYFWRPPYFPDRGTTHTNQPFPLTKQGQVDYMRHFTGILRKYPKVAGFFYWFPESVEVDPSSKLKYNNRSFFDEEGNALPAISALKGL